MPCVGTLVIDGDIGGTVFRVGTRCIMTAFHVIRPVVYDEASGGLNFQHLDRKDIYVNFNASIGSLPKIIYKLTCVFYSIELDVAVLDLNSLSGLPRKMLLYKGDTKIKIETVSVIGYGNPKQQLKKHFDPPCKVVPQHGTEIQAALDYFEIHRSHFKKAIFLNPDIVDDGYQGYDNPKNIIYHGYLEHGASGGPLLVSNDSRTVLVVGVLTHGIPEYFYHLPDEEKNKFPKDYRFHLACNMKYIYEAIRNENEDLAKDLFGGH
ncbi:uncharacterized protein LOC128558159 [Mercenaria mercenaria]|uniref:uncharacterized protein LOC128558159 n=1 Tax=Mercenaria mercenaria TaxID=6596 RepID=UPI00234F6483|nr:uncharacterized protein LOC128558159 [Mercenaria mercenaria]